MNAYRKYVRQALKAGFPAEADRLLATIDDQYKQIAVDTAFAATSGNPIDRRLDLTAYFLALIKTLDQQGESYETIRKVCLDSIIEYVKPKNKVQLWLKKLPAKLMNTWLSRLLLPVFNRKVSQNFHADGFIARIITDKNETYGLGYGIDILECGICKLFRKHQYEQYTSILCEVDEVTSSLAGLKLVRSGTIALGAHKCDFRFKKVKP